MRSHRLSVVALRPSGAGVWASPPPLLTRPPPSATAHRHLQREERNGENMNEEVEKVKHSTVQVRGGKVHGVLQY